MSIEDLDSLEETLEVLGDTPLLQRLRDGQAALATGDAIRGVAAAQALRPDNE